jgi:hypothetical protein
MKFDKDTLIKQRFWVLLALALPLAIVCVFVMLTVVRAEISGHQKKLNEAWKKLANASGDFRNEEWIKKIAAIQAEKKVNEKKVWGAAYDAQTPYFTWPIDFEKKYHFQDGSFIRDIKVYRKNKPPAGKNDASHFYGKIKSADRETLVVVGEKGEEKTFKQTTLVTYKVVLDDNAKDEKNFTDIKEGDFAAITYEIGKYFSDPLTEREQDFYAKTYHSQIASILAQVNPLNEKGGGVVQLANWPFNPDAFDDPDALPQNWKFFRYVAREWDVKKDISDEAWIAQEDLWIQRELYRMIRDANNYVSVFKGAGGDDNGKGKVFAFTNPYWKLELTLSGPTKLEYKITNLLSRRQRLDINFFVRLNKSSEEEPEVLHVGGHPPLNPRESHQGFKKLVGQPPTGIYAVEQDINWETAAVKRIDEVHIGSAGSHSHRTFPSGVKALKEKPVDKGKMKDMPKDFKGKMPEKFPGKGAGKDPAKALTHGLFAERYMDVTPQARRLPVAVVLIVDQDHVDRVLFAFQNSPLRFLTTQVLMNRFPGSMRPGGGKEPDRFRPKEFPKIFPKEPFPREPFPKGPFPKGPFPGGPSGPGGGPFPGGPFPGGPFPKGPFPKGPFPVGKDFRPPNQPSSQSGAGGDSQEVNMELVIYGIVTLYERYPPRLTKR